VRFSSNRSTRKSSSSICHIPSSRFVIVVVTVETRPM
jgi:hypothetical protein